MAVISLYALSGLLLLYAAFMCDLSSSDQSWWLKSGSTKDSPGVQHNRSGLILFTANMLAGPLPSRYTLTERGLTTPCSPDGIA